MENTRKNKERFFAQYFGQMVLEYKPNGSITDVFIGTPEFSDNFRLILKPIESITDEHVQQVARLALQVDRNFKILRDLNNKVTRAEHRTSSTLMQMSIFSDARIKTTLHLLDGDGNAAQNFIASIGEIGNNLEHTSKPTVPYIAIADYLRECGYAIPFNGISVKQLVEYGWVKLSQ